MDPTNPPDRPIAGPSTQSDAVPQHHSMETRKRLPARGTVPEAKKRRVARKPLQWFSARIEGNRAFVPEPCVRDRLKNRLDITGQLQDSWAPDHIPDIKLGSSSTDGLGVVAKRDFHKLEIVGRYRGTQVRHRVVST